MKVKVNPDICIGCGLCVQLAPAVFSMVTDKAVAIKEAVPSEHEDVAKDSVDKCPVAAITIEQ
jgi:ferredoxin